MSTEGKILVPHRPARKCPSCGEESYQRVAEDGESVLLIGKGQRFNARTAEILWNCRHCGAEHRLSLFSAEFQKGFVNNHNYDPKVVTKKVR